MCIRDRSELPAPAENQLYERIAAILDDARPRVARTVNTAMVQAYWLIGREIVLVEQHGAERAQYGEQLIEKLAPRLQRRFGKGFGVATLRRTRSFFQTYPSGSAIPAELGHGEIRSTALIKSRPEIRSTPLTESETVRFPPFLGWSHYLLLLRIKDDAARSFYEIEAARESWSVREL